MTNINPSPKKISANQHSSYGMFTLLGLLLPIVGIIVGIIYLTKPNLLDRKVGEHAIAMSIVGFILCFVAFQLLIDNNNYHLEILTTPNQLQSSQSSTIQQETNDEEEIQINSTQSENTQEQQIQYSKQQPTLETPQKSTPSSFDLPKSESVPPPPTKSTPEKIEGLTRIRVGSGIWENWDADMEKDGPVLDIVYYDNNDKIISTYETAKVPISIDLRIYTTNIEDIPHIKGRLVFSAHFTDNQILKTSSIYPKIRVPGEEISINPSIDYQYGYVELLLHTPSQGDFSDESDFIVLYDD